MSLRVSSCNWPGIECRPAIAVGSNGTATDLASSKWTGRSPSPCRGAPPNVVARERFIWAAPSTKSPRASATRGKVVCPIVPSRWSSQPTLMDPSRASAGRHTLWAYCHVPNGSTEDRSAAIEAQIERFAPGFRECIASRHAMNTTALEQRNANLIGGDSRRRRGRLQTDRGTSRLESSPASHADARCVSLLVVHAARDRRARYVWRACRRGGPPVALIPGKGGYWGNLA